VSRISDARIAQLTLPDREAGAWARSAELFHEGMARRSLLQKPNGHCENLLFPYSTYKACEISPTGIIVTPKTWPDTIHRRVHADPRRPLESIAKILGLGRGSPTHIDKGSDLRDFIPYLNRDKKLRQRDPN
jgi:hypothetical protein